MNPPTGDAPDTPVTGSGARGDTHPAADAPNQDAFWRSSFTNRPYVDAQLGYDHYRPAFRFGWEAQAGADGAEFEDVEEQLEERWENEPSALSWDEARPAVRDAWIHAASPESSDPGNPLV